MQIRLRLTQCFGFVANPSLSTNHNVAIQLGQMACWIYFHRPTNLACHDLCSTVTPPPNFRALLGMSLKFCPRPFFTTADLQNSFTRFQRDLSLRMFFAHKPRQMIVAKLKSKSD